MKEFLLFWIIVRFNIYIFYSKSLKYVVLQSLNFNLFHSFKSNFSNSRFNFHLFIWFYPLFFYIYILLTLLFVCCILWLFFWWVLFVRSFVLSFAIPSFFLIFLHGKKSGENIHIYERAKLLLLVFESIVLLLLLFFICVGLLLLRLWFFPNFLYFFKMKKFSFYIFFHHHSFNIWIAIINVFWFYGLKFVASFCLVGGCCCCCWSDFASIYIFFFEFHRST